MQNENHIEIEKDQDHTFSWTFFDKNIQKVPTSGNITVTKPGGSELVANTTVSIETDGEIRFTLGSANTSTIDSNYKIQLEYQVGDEKFRQFYLFDVVATPLVNTVRDEDLFLYVKELRDKNTPFVKETTAAGTTSTLISDELNSLNIDFTGGSVEVFTDDTTTHNAEITNWEKDLSRITFSPIDSVATTSGSRFRIRASYQRFIDEAYENIVSRDIRNRIKLKARFIDTLITRNMTIFKTLEIVCFSESEELDDKWNIRAKEFKLKYKEEYVKLSEPVDYNDDGTISHREDLDRPSFMNKGFKR